MHALSKKGTAVADCLNRRERLIEVELIDGLVERFQRVVHVVEMLDDASQQRGEHEAGHAFEAVGQLLTVIINDLDKLTVGVEPASA